MGLRTHARGQPRAAGEKGLPMGHERTVRIAQSCAQDPRAAVEELHAGLWQPGVALVLFFCSSDYDRDALAAHLGRLFPGVPVAGCTTAGEIGPLGCRDHSISGVSLTADVCTARVGRLEDLRRFRISDGVAFAQDLRRGLEEAVPAQAGWNSFAFLLVDGLSGHEEQLAHALQQGLGEIPLIGGSAGDSLSFESTSVYWDGRFSSDAAVLALVATPLPFIEFKTQHFEPTDERLVVTAARPDERVVVEINGLPAAEEYARILGLDVDDLDPAHFAASPVVVLIDGANYVRSIQQANPDGTLTFFCAIEEGVVLRVARGVDLAANLEQAFAKVRADVGEPQLVLACDCILRKLEIDQSGLEDDVGEIYRRNRVVGFNTYGEQFCGVHVNQTLTGVAFGSGSAGTVR
jgi:hypothetical protein